MTPYLHDIGGLGGIKITSASTSSANEPAKELSFVNIVQLKTMIKVRRSVRFSILRENTSEVVNENDYYYFIINIMYKLQGAMVFSRHQKLNSTRKLRPEK